MRKLLQINPVLRVNTSTGRIMQEIGELAMQNGWESYIAYSRGRDGIKSCKSHILPVGNYWSVAYHGIMTRLFDCHGLESKQATRKFVRQIKALKPDIIHIHNVHGYFLNYKILFNYLAHCDIPIIIFMPVATNGRQNAENVHKNISFLRVGYSTAHIRTSSIRNLPSPPFLRIG